jgi:hypothetical protein
MVQWSSSQGDPNTTWNRDNEWSYCVLMYSYENSVKVQPAVATCCKSTIHIHMECHKGLYIYYSKCTNWCLVAHTCEYTDICHVLGYWLQTDFKSSHREISNGVKSKIKGKVNCKICSIIKCSLKMCEWHFDFLN